MGIYFDSTTDEEDAEIIIRGIKKGLITSDFYLVELGITPSDEDIVWIPKEDGKVIINGVHGELTSIGNNFILSQLMKAGRYSTTL
jgi:hypothetical protein